MLARIPAKMRGVAALTIGTVALATASCKSLTGLPAGLSTVADSGIIYAINGAPSGAPTAVHFFTGSRTAADASFFFDVAFDIDGGGNVVLLPQRTVASQLTTTHGVGLQKSSQAYDAITEAIKSGYRADTALIVSPGQTVLVQVQDPACAVSIASTSIYGKLEILSVDKVARTMQIQYVADPNCGFLSFATGIPKN